MHEACDTRRASTMHVSGGFSLLLHDKMSTNAELMPDARLLMGRRGSFAPFLIQRPMTSSTSPSGFARLLGMGYWRRWHHCR
jgi:hypothetical protein